MAQPLDYFTPRRPVPTTPRLTVLQRIGRAMYWSGITIVVIYVVGLIVSMTALEFGWLTFD